MRTLTPRELQELIERLPEQVKDKEIIMGIDTPLTATKEGNLIDLRIRNGRVLLIVK